MSTAHHNLSLYNISEMPTAENFRFAVLVADWNKEITTVLCEGAVNTLKECKAKAENIKIMHVPGSFELPGGAAMIASQSDYDAIICLGCIIQGETRHFEFIAQAVANGLTNLSIQYNMPVIFGVLTTDTMVQALERSGGKLGNKGVEAALTAIRMVELKNTLK